jgi:hypothetical protein
VNLRYVKIRLIFHRILIDTILYSQLVDTTEIYLMPSMNPDGYTASKPGCATFGGFNLFGLGGTSGRENANSVDLNRDFPKQFDERQDVDSRTLESGRQPETIALMRWIKVPFMSFYPDFILI